MKKILFLSLCSYDSIAIRDIYTDLLREMTKYGHYVVIASPLEKKYKRKPKLIKEENSEIVEILIDNYFNVGSIKKGLSLLTIDKKFKKVLSQKYKEFHFDMVLYATPPIMFINTIKYFKSKGAFTYLMLKDIFPQNAVDIGLMRKTGLKGLLYKFFRKQEKRLYAISDKIGCMSPANVEYVLEHNNEIDKNKVEVFPNCIDVQIICLTDEEKKQIRIKYELPLDKKIFVYGGNLGKPQGIQFVIECLEAEKDNDNAFFLIVGSGTEYSTLEQYSNKMKQANFKLLKRLPTIEFDRLLASCDVGLLFLDHRFTIPNFPSRLLSYLQAGLPVLACTDVITDIGRIIVDGHFGWWCESNNPKLFVELVDEIILERTNDKSLYSKEYLNSNFSTRNCCKKILVFLDSIPVENYD